ncbi:hypothetical protein HDU87_002951 [Geranomyces variabilis]|uniref:Uncharacterized protein n=1 Tax=Geranomyces variabilis TaxID=109894 RepID=A0AAD5XT05_9FUNG|nr:hypothetical protein HDU87_002951 [Geranomyces variabilis]
MSRALHTRAHRTRKWVDADIGAIIKQFEKPAPDVQTPAPPVAKKRKLWAPLENEELVVVDGTVNDEESLILHKSTKVAKKRHPQFPTENEKKPGMENTVYDEDLYEVYGSTEDDSDNAESEGDDDFGRLHRASSDDSVVVSDESEASINSSDSESSTRPDEARMFQCNCPHCPNGNEHYENASSPTRSDSSNESLIQTPDSSNGQMEDPPRTKRPAAKEAKMNLKDLQRII